jgi:pimeloyl-ACP methyl ester carboxylesterase
MSDAPVLLVHGFATSAARTWGENGWLDLLADAGREVIAPDLLGHGSADKPHDPSAYDDLEANVLATVVAATPDGVVDAIGFSLGARVILTLAASHPERFGRIVVAGVGANLFSTEGGSLVADAVAGRGDPANPVVQYFAGLAAHPESDREALAACITRPRPALDAEILSRITNPVLVVLGDQDFAGPADPLVDALPDATFRPLRGVDHFATPKDFGFIDAALEFLGCAP